MTRQSFLEIASSVHLTGHKSNGLVRFLDVPVDSEGLLVDALERALKAHRVRAAYVTPHHHFPRR